MKRPNKTKFIFIFSLVIVVFLSGFLGYLWGHQNLILDKQRIPQLVNLDLGGKNKIDFSLFKEAYDRLQSEYLGTIDPQKFLYGAISGAFNSLGDPYTAFLPPDSSAELESELSGDLEGIGVRIGILDQTPAVITPLPNSPAQRSGLKPRDKVLEVDSTSTNEMTLDEVVNRIRGKAGTKVKLTILREGEKDIRTIEITREKISVNTVELNYRGDTAIISLSEFGVKTKPDFNRAANEIAAKGINKVVLDLRNNPGGLLDAATDVASDLFPDGTTVVIEDAKDGKSELKTKGDGVLKNAKLVVLVNQGSASAAEIVAGAIKDHKRGILIGEKTFGKGTVQQLETISGGSSVKITVARWLTPSGQSIDKNGIEPDVVMKEKDNALFSVNDPLLKKALQEF